MPNATSVTPSDFKFLLVVDEPDRIRKVMDAATLAGMRFVLSPNQKEAASCMPKDNFRLAVIDLALSPAHPEQGLSIIKQLRESQPHCRIIGLTQPSRNALGYQALRLGADDFICADPLINWQHLLRERLKLWSNLSVTR